MVDHSTFSPDWVSSPGDTIEDLLEERDWTKTELARRLGVTKKHLNELLRGRATLSADMAARLAMVLGSTEEFWLRREAQYRAGLQRQARLDALRSEAGWLQELPKAWMIKQGWIQQRSHRGAQVEELLRFFGVADVPAWRHTYGEPLVAFRASSRVKMKAGSVAAWLCRAESEAAAIQTAPYARERFKQLLPELRRLTNEADPDVFVPSLQSSCAACGVSVVFVPAPPGAPVFGATRWLRPDKAMLALSLRYKANDHLWFTFFHEACHVLRHAKRKLFVEGVAGLDRELEEEADRFAADVLVPPSEVAVLSTLRTREEVLGMAEELGVAPGILVGRMQHEGWIQWSELNELKVRYRWSEEG